MSAKKLLDHYFCQTLHYYLGQRKTGKSCRIYLMYKDKIQGAIHMIELLDCDSDLKNHAFDFYNFISHLDDKSTDEIIAKLSETRAKT